MFCTRCGKEIPREARFCGNCGAPVFSESFPAEERRPSGNNMAQQSPAEAAVGANRGYAAAAAPTVPCEASPAPAYPQRPKKKIPVWVWITVGVVALLIAAAFGISRASKGRFYARNHQHSNLVRINAFLRTDLIICLL